MIGENVMSEFKFVCREEELTFVQEELSQKKFIIYYYFNDSGLTHYLKKLSFNLNNDNEICFYVDCAKNQSIAIQIATQIISSSDKRKLSKYTQNEGLVIKRPKMDSRGHVGRNDHKTSHITVIVSEKNK